jgi:hypothetical protein
VGAPSRAGPAEVVGERGAGHRAGHPVDDLHRTARGGRGEVRVDPVELVERALPLLLAGGELVALGGELGVHRPDLRSQVIVGLVGPVEQCGRPRALARVLRLEQHPEVGARVLVCHRCPPLRDGAQLCPTRFPRLDFLVEGGDLVVEQVVASFDVRVLGGCGGIGIPLGIRGGLPARRAGQQRGRYGRDRADRDENAPNRRKLAHRTSGDASDRAGPLAMRRPNRSRCPQLDRPRMRSCSSPHLVCAAQLTQNTEV